MDKYSVPKIVAHSVGEGCLAVSGYRQSPFGVALIQLGVLCAFLYNLPFAPAEEVLDVLVAARTPEDEATANWKQCPRLIHERFDRQPAPILDLRALTGIQRRVFTTLPDGRKILLRTKTSARDFLAGAPSPGFVWD